MERCGIRLEDFNVYDTSASAHIDDLLPEYLERKRLEDSRRPSKEKRPLKGLLAPTPDKVQKKTSVKIK